ncbi:hypothetical protein [Grimontia marina]|uniref:MSHA biogenesis protein MshI n=1 Tax=Grimontia marina TaxID=646534 RepID=A0A128EWQ8_9GAMM|nr:hypothetical protein [Grimontia marina]CZF78441.1 hypothetical protein GMA8713_00575 [Grimontia marina]
MAVSTLFAKLSPVKQRDVVSLVASAEQVVIAYQDGNGKTQLDAQTVTQSDLWMAATQLIARHEISKANVHLVLGHGLYQSLLIDDPGLSDEDKRAALPFQLKDFISDSPSDIVADGFSSPVANRFQAFVCHKLPLIQFSKALEKSQCRLTNVSLEDVVLRQWTRLDKTEMVLSRDSYGVLQLAAFHLGRLCFQRQIRGVILEGQMMSPSVVDDLALEVQRSLDYLRSQLKSVQVTGLVVSVHGIDDTELAFQLSSRLSVAVRPQQLFETEAHHQHIAIAALNCDYSPDVNLFSDGLSPKAPLLTFEKMLLVWGATSLLVVLVAAYQQFSLGQAKQFFSVADSERQSAQSLSDELNEQLALHLPSISLTNEVNEKKASIDAKRRALTAVKKHDAALQQGHADTFRALASLSRRDISVSSISVSQNALDLKGLASTPSSVPAWLQSFSTQPSLSDRVFEQMALSRDEKNRLNFNLVSKRENGGSAK